MKNLRSVLMILLVLLVCLTACSPQIEQSGDIGEETTQEDQTNMETEIKDVTQDATVTELPSVSADEKATVISRYTDKNGDIAIIPAEFTVSAKEDEQTVNTGVVVIGPDGSEFVWVPTTETELAVRDFGSYFYGGSISGYWDETDQTLYQDMVKSVEQYGGFYMGRFEQAAAAVTVYPITFPQASVCLSLGLDSHRRTAPSSAKICTPTTKRFRASSLGESTTILRSNG